MSRRSWARTRRDVRRVRCELAGDAAAHLAGRDARFNAVLARSVAVSLRPGGEWLLGGRPARAPLGVLRAGDELAGDVARAAWPCSPTRALVAVGVW